MVIDVDQFVVLGNQHWLDAYFKDILINYSLYLAV